MAIKQAFPHPDVPLVDENGAMSLVWFRFLATLWNRTGAAVGNNSASFLYPLTNGNPGQVLTSQGANPTIWTTLLTKLSQFSNDVGFITASALTGFATTDSTQLQIESNESTTIPPPDSTDGQAGVSTRTARADHAHPREVNPHFAGTCTAKVLSLGPATWTAGSGAPSAAQPNGSLYSNTSGATGSRLYVSNGTTWAAVAGV